MRDLTAVLMGDPAASYRRPPTEQERHRPNSLDDQVHVRKVGRKRTSDYYHWKIGEARQFSSFREAKNRVAGLYSKGMLGSLRTRKDGTYTVTRMQ